MDVTPFDRENLFKRFFDRSNMLRKTGFFDLDPFRMFEEMHEEMERMLSQFEAIPKNAPKELVREYQTPEGDKVREIGPIVYGYSMTMGPDGKPRVQEFGNVKPYVSGKEIASSELSKQQLTAEREPLVDVNSTDKEVKVILEIPGVKKDDIKINAYVGIVEVIANNSLRKYHKSIELPDDADTETARSTYNNGILEITFNKKENTKPKGRGIKIE